MAISLVTTRFYTLVWNGRSYFQTHPCILELDDGKKIQETPIFHGHRMDGFDPAPSPGKGAAQRQEGGPPGEGVDPGGGPPMAWDVTSNMAGAFPARGIPQMDPRSWMVFV